MKRIALNLPSDLGQPFATWSFAKLADYLVSEGVVTDISHEGLRQLLREEGVSFQALRGWKRSNDPDFERKKNRILSLYAIADGLAVMSSSRTLLGIRIREHEVPNHRHKILVGADELA